MIRSFTYTASVAVLVVVTSWFAVDRLGDGIDSTWSPAATTAQVPPTVTQPPPREAVLAFTGDLLPHGPVVERAQALAGGSGYDFDPMFRLVSPILAQADLALCHLETPLSYDNTGLGGYPTFNVPRELADAIARAGYDGCSVASNHSWDRGRQGVIDTRRVLAEAGVSAAGTAADQAEGPTLYQAGDFTVAHLSYTFGLNGFELPIDEPWLVDLIGLDQIADEAALARARGAEFVVLSLHWGAEYQAEPTADQVSQADALLALDDIDLIVGHHAHVVQPIDRLDGEVVIYGLGNFLSNQSASCCPAAAQDGVIVLVELRELGHRLRADVSYVPTWVDRSTFTIVPARLEVSDGETSVAADVLAASRERTAAVLRRLGVAVTER